ncbi:MAG: HDOD domain-containing protein [Planctomycetaceae bacterium]|jgi:HD-like signal output (HDOD) protein|nr:HDOD domain-containing protein [Planctomycetaceae bacterium]
MRNVNPRRWSIQFKQFKITMSINVPDSLAHELQGCKLLALPQSAAKVLELAKNPENGPPELAVPISADPGLMAQILKFANSSFFGFRHKITAVQMALSLICVRTIKNFVIWNAVFAMLPNPKVGPFVLRLVLQDALRRGIFCKVYASYFPDVDPEDFFVIGLFQDIAIPVLAQNKPAEYTQFLNKLDDGKTRLSTLEYETFGWSHADAGAFLVQEWGLGEDFALLIQQHTSNELNDQNSNTPITPAAIVKLSSILPSAKETEWKDVDKFMEWFQKLIGKLNGAGKKIPTPAEVFTLCDAQFDDMLQITQTQPPQLSLSDHLQKYNESF